MRFEEAIKELLKEGKIRRSYWRKGVFIMFNDYTELCLYDTIYNTEEHYLLKAGDLCSNDWEIFETKPILDDKEKEYLSAIIKPFKDKVENIMKGSVIDKEFIVIKLGNEVIHLPYFEKNSMYKGMKENKIYTLKELDL